MSKADRKSQDFASITTFEQISSAAKEFCDQAVEEYQKDYHSKTKDDSGYVKWRQKISGEFSALVETIDSLMLSSEASDDLGLWYALLKIKQDKNFLKIEELSETVQLEKNAPSIFSKNENIKSNALKDRFIALKASIASAREFDLDLEKPTADVKIDKKDQAKLANIQAKKQKKLVAELEKLAEAEIEFLKKWHKTSKEKDKKSKKEDKKKSPEKATDNNEKLREQILKDNDQIDKEDLELLGKEELEQIIELQNKFNHDLGLLNRAKERQILHTKQNLSTDESEKDILMKEIEENFNTLEFNLKRSANQKINGIIGAKKLTSLEDRYFDYLSEERSLGFLTKALEELAKELTDFQHTKISDKLKKPEYTSIIEDYRALAVAIRSKFYYPARAIVTHGMEIEGAGYERLMRSEYGELEARINRVTLQTPGNDTQKKNYNKDLEELVEYTEKLITPKRLEKYIQILSRFRSNIKPQSKDVAKVTHDDIQLIAKRMKYLITKIEDGVLIAIDQPLFVQDKIIKTYKEKCGTLIKMLKGIKATASELANENFILINSLFNNPDITKLILSPEDHKNKFNPRFNTAIKEKVNNFFQVVLGGKKINEEEFDTYIITEYLAQTYSGSPEKVAKLSNPIPFDAAGGLKEMGPKILAKRKEQLLKDEAQFAKKGKEDEMRSKEELPASQIIDSMKKSNQAVTELAKSSKKDFAQIEGFIDNLISSYNYFKSKSENGELVKELTTDKREEKKAPAKQMSGGDIDFSELYSTETGADKKSATPKPTLTIPTKYSVAKDAADEWLIGDIHGDMNALLTALITSKFAMFKEGEESYVIYDTLTGERCSSYPKDISDREIWARYRLIPNLQLNPEFNGRITFLGDILDRGVASDECLYTLFDLCRQEKALFQTDRKESSAISAQHNYSKNRKLNLVFADHELYGLNKEAAFTPSYLLLNKRDKTTSSIHLLDRNFEIADRKKQDSDDIEKLSDSGLQAVSSAIRKAIKDDLITYGHIGTNGIIYSHSFYTKECFEHIITQLSGDSESLNANEKISRAGKNKEELAEVIKAMKYWIGLDEIADKSTIDYQSEEFQKNAKIVVDHFNQVLKFAASHPEIYYDTLKLYSKFQSDSRHPLFAFDEVSPISTRGKPLPAIMANGHTAQRDTFNFKHISQASGIGESYDYSRKSKEVPYPIFIFDCGNSYMYDAHNISHPTAFLVTKDGEISGTRFAKEEEMFLNGGINPQFLDKGITPSATPAAASVATLGDGISELTVTDR